MQNQFAITHIVADAQRRSELRRDAIDHVLVATQHGQMHRRPTVVVLRSHQPCGVRPLQNLDHLLRFVLSYRPVQLLARLLEFLDAVEESHQIRVIALGGDLADGQAVLVLQVAYVIVALEQQMLEVVDVTGGGEAEHPSVDLGCIGRLAGLVGDVARGAVQLVAVRNAHARLVDQLAEPVRAVRASTRKMQQTLAVLVLCSAENDNNEKCTVTHN